MTTSILNDCLLLRDSPTEAFFTYMKDRGITVFDQLFKKLGNVEETKDAVLFILCAYSEDSPLLVIRQDNKEEKEQICEYLQIPQERRQSLIDLTSHEVRRAVTKYMTTYAGVLFKSLMFMKIQLNDFELDITNRNFGSSRTIEGKDGVADEIVYLYDIKEHGKAISEHGRLSKQIEQLEKQIRAQVKRHEGIEAIIEWKNKKGQSKSGSRGVSMENSEQI